jgi:hypothetical protein
MRSIPKRQLHFLTNLNFLKKIIQNDRTKLHSTSAIIIITNKKEQIKIHKIPKHTLE